MSKSNTFCINQFYQFMVKTNGTSGVCCNLTSKNEEILGNVNDTSIKDIWNSEFYKTLRLQLLNGEKPDVCTKCWKEEDEGLDSVRITSNREFELVDADIDLDKCVEDGGQLEINPGFLDLRLGNLCNLKCRSCSSDQSSQIQKENLKLEKKYANLPVMHMFGTNKNDTMFDWINDDNFWEELQDILPSVNLIYFVGGEPTLHERHYEILQKIIDDCRANEVKLQYNTNLTNIQDRFITLTNQFREEKIAVVSEFAVESVPSLVPHSMYYNIRIIKSLFFFASNNILHLGCNHSYPALSPILPVRQGNYTASFSKAMFFSWVSLSKENHNSVRIERMKKKASADA